MQANQTTFTNDPKQDSASKQVYINFMSQENKDSDIVLQEIVDDMVDNKKFKSY